MNRFRAGRAYSVVPDGSQGDRGKLGTVRL
jgi:hypothetical protein